MENNIQAPAPETDLQPQEMKRDITDSVLKRINELQESNTLVLPKNYNPGNALKSALLIIRGVVDKNKRPALEVCTKTSIVNALFDMCIAMSSYTHQWTFDRSYVTWLDGRKPIPQNEKRRTELHVLSQAGSQESRIAAARRDIESRP